jgi:hypothetical protein
MKKEMEILEISGKAGTDTALLRRGVDGHEDELRLPDALLDVGREEQVAAAACPNDVLEARLVDGELEVRAVPRIDTRLVEIDDGDSDVRAFQCDNSACRTTFARSIFVQSNLIFRDIPT